MRQSFDGIVIFLLDYIFIHLSQVKSHLFI